MLYLLFREDPFTRRPITVTDVKFEMSCVLYNIGALHSILGGMDSRQSPEVCCSLCESVLFSLLCSLVTNDFNEHSHLRSFFAP